MIELYKCQKCGKSVFEKFGSGKFCSRSCANSRKFSKETNLKRSESNKLAFVKNPALRDICSKTAKALNASRKGLPGPMKGKHHTDEAKKKISLSKVGKVGKVGKKVSDETKQKLRAAMLKRVKDGTHSGWQSRNIASYAENFFINVLANELPNVSYKREKRFGKYFLDFFFENKMLDLEIDGKQHLYKERAKSDKKRDEFLKENNVTVYRIPWNEINSASGKKEMKEKIKLFINFYKNLPVVHR